MKKQLIILMLITSISSFAHCIDLSGDYKIISSKDSCSIKQAKQPILIHSSDIAILSLVAKPGPRYGHFLNKIVATDNKSIQIMQSDCKKISINHIQQDKQSSIDIIQGKFPYFGARSPIFVNTKIRNKSVKQLMLITKFTTIANGQSSVIRDLKYSSNLSLTKNKDLLVSYKIKFGKNDKEIEEVKCLFIRD